MKESYVVVNLNEADAKKLSQVLSNKTSKKILDFLSVKKATESAIAKDLRIPLSTVHYNLKLLADAHMVVADEYHYSQKGKVVNHYSLANKLVVIAPVQKRVLSLKAKLTALVPAVLVSFVGAALLYAASQRSVVQSSIAVDKALEAAPRLMAADAAEAGVSSVVQPGLLEMAWPWFLIGALLALVIYVGLDFVLNRKRFS
ncbi:MAG: helix-turn-helix domain-containing protein [Nanoarchaeota archaeon]